MKRSSLSWSWRPDLATEKALKRGTAKVRGLPIGAGIPHYGGIITKPGEQPKRRRIMATKTKTASKKRTVATTAENGSSGVPLKKICADLGIEPRLARRKLRAADLDFHGSRERWTFSKAQVPKVKEVLQPAAQ
jgi:hypothetical protein